MIAIPAVISPTSLCLPGPGETQRELAGETMGTTWAVTFFAPMRVDSSAVRQRIERELDRLVAQMSHWRDDSCLSHFNRADPGTWVRLPPEFLEVLACGLEVAHESGGAFDPALGRDTDRWGFGPSGHRSEPPEQTGPRCGATWREIRLDPGQLTALQPGEVHLDFSSIAKGFAVDQVARLLERMGIRVYMVEIGGELRGCGVKPDQQPWWVAVEPPPGCPLDIRIALTGSSIATSGNYRRWFEHRGRRYSHTLDPGTRAPLLDPPGSVSVVHEDCMLADAWSTALMVQGVETGLQYCVRQQLAAFFLYEDGGGEWKLAASPAFEEMLS